LTESSSDGDMTVTDLLMRLRTAEAALSRARALVVHPDGACCGNAVILPEQLHAALRTKP
jgi:hypothetical protein